MQLQLSTDGIVTNMLLTIVWPCSAFSILIEMEIFDMMIEILIFIFKIDFGFKMD